MPLLMTSDQMLAELRRKLDEPVPSRFANTTLYAFLNEAAEALLPRVGAVNEVVTLSTVAGTPTIDLGTTHQFLLYILNATVIDSGGVGTELGFYSAQYMLRQWPQAGVAGAPQGRPTAACITGAESDRRLLLYPTPNAVYTIRLMGIALPTALAVAAGQVPELPHELRRLCTDLAFAYCLERIGKVQEAELRRRYVFGDIADVSFRFITQGLEDDVNRDLHWWDVYHV